jgi:hypothetical protein
MRTRYSILIIFICSLLSCNNQIEKAVKQQNKTIDCNTLSDKKIVYTIAKSILDKKDNNQIWNLSEVDTSELLTTEDFFTNDRTKSRLVLIGGSAGLSSGTADNLLIIFECTDTSTVIWSGQVGDISLTDIKDLDNDGIKEIVCNESMTWMGECNDSYKIFNFKGGHHNIIYSTHSNSIIDCGKEEIGDFYKKGDTLETKYNCLLLENMDKTYNIRQIKTIKIHNGGKSDKDILKYLKVVIDTSVISINDCLSESLSDEDFEQGMKYEGPESIPDPDPFPGKKH